MACHQALVADVGGTHARFALARWTTGQVPRLANIITAATADFPSLQAATLAYLAQWPADRPQQAAFAVATTMAGDIREHPDAPWACDHQALAPALGFERALVFNDFGAIARAVPALNVGDLVSLRAAPFNLPERGVISVIGPGTGLGVAQLLRLATGAHVVETEGGHVGFAPTNAAEAELARLLMQRHDRLTLERVVCGPGFKDLCAAVAQQQGQSYCPPDDIALWTGAIDGSDSFAASVLDQYCGLLGAAMGDLVLAHGADALVIAGGLIPRFARRLRASAFLSRFEDKGPFAKKMATTPVALCVHPHPGLLGAALALT